MDSVLMIDQDLVTNAVHMLALSILSAYQRGAPIPWNEAELAIYLVYIFGEIGKSKSSVVFHYVYSSHISLDQLAEKVARRSVKPLPLQKRNEKRLITLNILLQRMDRCFLLWYNQAYHRILTEVSPCNSSKL
jgi:hypothetical protein